MNISKKYIIIFFCLSVFLTPAFCSAENSKYNLERIFYLPKYNAEKGVESVNKNWQKIDILAPQMHVVTADFAVSGGFGPKLKKAISDHKMRVMPLIANANFSRDIIHNLLSSESGQDKVIASLVKLAKSNKYIGWQFDFENIDYKDRDLYSAFVERTYQSFKQNNLVLSVVAVARTTDYEDTDAFKSWSGVYDYKRIAGSCDFVSIMAYDDPNSVGPTASSVFVNSVLSYTKDKIPSEKLSLGVPLYYWKWSLDSLKRIGTGLYKNVLAIKENYRHSSGFDPKLCVSWLTYSYNNKIYAIWFENRQSFEAKLNIAKENNLRGFSAWLIGGEDPAIWSAL